MLLFVLSAMVVANVEAQIIFKGQCPVQNVIQNFDVAQYTGIWYEYSNYFAAFQAKQQCVTATYSQVASVPNGVQVVNSGSFVGIPKKIQGYAVLTDPSANEGKLRVQFFSKQVQQGGEPNYWILDTGYTSYSIVWSCTPGKFGDNYNTQLLWILTRQRKPSSATINQAYRFIRQRGLDTSQLVKTFQSKALCPQAQGP